MIFQNIDFHNVEEITPEDNGFALWRLPRKIREQLNDTIRDVSARYCTGVELRFKIKGDSADIFLSAREAEEAQVAYLYYGSFQGGWQISSKVIHSGRTRIQIPRPQNLDALKEITQERGLGFNPEVVRIVLPYGCCSFLGAEGEIEPPCREDLPEAVYLAYGSSITHGSLGLAAPYAYPFRIAARLGCDSVNLGFAGSAQLEKAAAEYLVSRKDWDFASVELGINMLGDAFTEELFEERVDVFTQILAQDPRPVFATSIFGFNADKQEKAERYREIVQRYAGERLIFTEGRKLLDNPAFISQDMTHPSLEGMEQIAGNWYQIMRREL